MSRFGARVLSIAILCSASLAAQTPDTAALQATVADPTHYKLIADRATDRILGCHVVGERAVEIVQVVAIAMAAGLRVENPAKIPLSFPTYTGIVARAAYRAAHQIYPEFSGRVDAPNGGLSE